jgi:uncharacterized protein YjgD (DUF1641 family)
VKAVSEQQVAQVQEGAAASWGNLGQAVVDALTDDTVSRLAERLTRWAELLARPEWEELVQAALPLLPHVRRFLEALRPLVEAGLLERLAAWLGLAMAVEDAVTPNQVQRLVQEGEELLTLAHRVMTQNPADLWMQGLSTVSEAWKESAQTARPVGLWSLVRRLRHDPQVQRLLAFLLALAERAGRA